MHQLERVTNLLALLLTSRRHMTFEEIRRELPGQYPDNLVAARAAFERDKALLRDEGVPIDATTLGGDQAGTTGYRILRSAYELGDLGLAPQETAALRLAVGTLRMGQPWGEEALWKLDSDSFMAPGIPDAVVSTFLPTDENLPAVHQAISEGRCVEFSYGGRSRLFAPYGLLARNGHWYMIGQDEGIAQRRTFRLDRVEGAVEVKSEMRYDRPQDFDVCSAFPTDIKALPGSLDVGSDIAHVRIAASDVEVVRAQYGEDTVVERSSDGSAIFVIPCSNVDAFLYWLFGFVERAEVLDPPALRAHVIGWLRAMTQEDRS